MRFGAALVLFLASVAPVSHAFGEGDRSTVSFDELSAKIPEHIQIQIEYRKVPEMSDRAQWYIADARFSVRLRPLDRHDLEQLDKKKRYDITGIVVEQNFGVFDIWVRDIRVTE